MCVNERKREGGAGRVGLNPRHQSLRQTGRDVPPPHARRGPMARGCGGVQMRTEGPPGQKQGVSDIRRGFDACARTRRLGLVWVSAHVVRVLWVNFVVRKWRTFPQLWGLL